MLIRLYFSGLNGMKYYRAIIFLFLPLIFTAGLQAEVQRSQLTNAIEEREPTDNVTEPVFIGPDDVKTLYYFTHITNMAGKQIVHRWLYNGNEMAAVTLNIGSESWRTYSSKRIVPQWDGEWQIQVWHQDLQLTSTTFKVVTE